jgi:hypothetical protein
MLFNNPSAKQPFLSNWNGLSGIGFSDTGLSGDFSVNATQQQMQVGIFALQAYNQQSQLHESVADGRIEFYVRHFPNGGQLHYFTVLLDEYTAIEVLNADGATPTSDASGDTMWSDGRQHLATVQEMSNAAYALRPSMDLLAAMAFGFHGSERTSNEGTVVINNVVHRVNAGRAALCVRGAYARIGLYSAEQVQQCEQAIGGGPVILWQGKIANPAVGQETEQYLPFNPLNEDFVQLDWRKHIYNGTFPKTAVAIGNREDGRSYVVMAVSYGLTGIELAEQLQQMGCFVALGGDDDTSTQATWRGNPTFQGNPRRVPDALAVYIRQ